MADLLPRSMGKTIALKEQIIVSLRDAVDLEKDWSAVLITPTSTMTIRLTVEEHK